MAALKSKLAADATTNAMWNALVVSLIVACAVSYAVEIFASGVQPHPDGLKRAQAEEALRAHNVWRRRVGVLSLRWAMDLAVMAQTRAAYLASHGCAIEHGVLPDDVGENLFHAEPLRAEGRKDELNPLTATQVVDAWGAESAAYSQARHACAPGRQCGHYTQVVWPNTEEVGCGMAVCPTLGQVWVCDYRPRGNVRVR